MLITSIFFFTHNVFYPKKARNHQFSNTYFSSLKPWSHQPNRGVTNKKSFYPFVSVLCFYPMNPLLVRRYLVISISSGLSFEHVQNFPPDKTDKDACLMYGHYVAFTLHKSISRVSSVRGDEFCHRITKFCMFCPFSLRNKSVCRSDQALSAFNLDQSTNLKPGRELTYPFIM